MKVFNFLLITFFFILQADRISAQGNSVFKNPHKKKTIRLSVDTILYRYQYEPIVLERDRLKEEINGIKKEISLKNDTIALLQDYGVDDFLNIQDTTIFESNFLERPVDEIAPRSKDFYLLVRNIHDLNLLLAEMENMNIAQLSSVGNKLIDARSLIDEINSYASIERRKITDFLSEEQKQYFRDLVERFNTLNALINPQ